MPNWCTSYIRIEHEDQAKIADLYSKIERWAESPAMEGISGAWRHSWLGNIVLNSEIGTVDTCGATDIKCRGWMDEIWLNSPNEIYIHTETAWSPMLRMWLKLIDKYLPGANLVFTSEESGNGIYVSNDPEIEFTYNLYEDEGDTLYELTDDELVEVLREKYLSNETTVDKLLEILENDKNKDTWVVRYDHADPEDFD